MLIVVCIYTLLHLHALLVDDTGKALLSMLRDGVDDEPEQRASGTKRTHSPQPTLADGVSGMYLS